MRSFKLRVNDLLEKTTNEVVRENANAVLKMLDYNKDSKVLSNILVEKIKEIKELTKVEENFIKNENRIVILEDLNLNNIFAKLFESQDLQKSNPQLPYILHQLKTSLDTKQQLASSVAESLVNILSRFTFIPTVDLVHSELVNTISENREDLISMNLATTLKGTNSNFYNNIIESLESYIYDKESISRANLLEQLRKFEYEPAISSYMKEISKFGAKDGLSMVSENRDFYVSPIYSFVRIDEDNSERSVFYAGGSYYEKHNLNLRRLNETQVAFLPDDFKQISVYLTNPNIVINENSFNTFIGTHKLSIKEDENKEVKMFLNENMIKVSNPYQYLVQSGVFKMNELDEVAMVTKIYENFDSLVNIDFGKIIGSKINKNVGALVFKMNERMSDNSFYTNVIDQNNRTNEFISKINSVQLRNKLMEFMNYDISESLHGFVDNTTSKIAAFKEEQNSIEKEIRTLNEQLTKVEEAERDPLSSDAIKNFNLRAVIAEEIARLNEEYKIVQGKINRLQKVEDSQELNEAREDELYHKHFKKFIGDQYKTESTRYVDLIFNNSVINKGIFALLKFIEMKNIKAANKQFEQTMSDYANLPKKPLKVTEVSRFLTNLIVYMSKVIGRPVKNVEYDSNTANIILESQELNEDTGKPDTGKFRPNSQVRIKKSGVIGKVTAINSVTKELSVLTDEGDTINCPFDQAELIEDTVAKNADEMQAQAQKAADTVQANESLTESLKENFLGYGLKKKLNETVTPQGDDQFTGYGVKGEKRAKGNERSEMKGAKDPAQKFMQEDKKVLADIDSRVTRGIELFSDLENMLEQYTKVNRRPISSVLNQLKAFKEAIVAEIGKI